MSDTPSMDSAARERVGRALDLCRERLGPYVEGELRRVYGDEWQGRLEGEPRDLAVLLKAIVRNWNVVFASALPRVARSYLEELRDVRNRWAHWEEFSAEDALRAQDTVQRFLAEARVQPQTKVATTIPDMAKRGPASGPAPDSLVTMIESFLVSVAAGRDLPAGQAWQGRKIFGRSGAAMPIPYLTFLGKGDSPRTACYPAVYVYRNWGRVFSVYGRGSEAPGYPGHLPRADTIEGYFRAEHPSYPSAIRGFGGRFHYLDNRYKRSYPWPGDEKQLAVRLSEDVAELVREFEAP